MEPRDRPPGNQAHLEKLIVALAGETGQVALRLRRTIANTVVGQMLPPGAVKGGSAMKLRLGTTASRFTPDLDFARRGTLQAFLDELNAKLTVGWGGFTGRVVALVPAKPAAVPSAYVMRPYEVKLSYMHKSWCTVVLEVGPDEIGDTDDPVWLIADELLTLFAALGLPQPEPQPVLSAEHQIAQKLHATSAPDSERAHDLIDLQLLSTSTTVDLVAARIACERLFTSRKSHSWPPTVVEGAHWDTLYAASTEGLELACEDVAAAVVWANKLIGDITTAG